MNKKPNVLVFFSDQHNASVLGCEGHPDVLTPNLDQLASEGMRFRRAYCQDAVCIPSRMSFTSGVHPRTMGCLCNSDVSPIADQVVSLQSAMKANGYTTAAFGKRHLYGGCDEGWDQRASHMYEESPEDNYVSWIEGQGLEEAFARDWGSESGRGPEGSRTHATRRPTPIFSAQASELPEDATMEAWTARRTMDFLKERSGHDAPFFCFSSFYRPHQPYNALPRYLEAYQYDRWGGGAKRGEGLVMPASLRQSLEELPPLLQDWRNGSNGLWRMDLAQKDEALYRFYIASYYALVTEIDAQIGQVLRTLEETGQAENTIVIYTSDHGDFVGAHGMVEKCAWGHNVYEDTLRIPMLMRYPKHIPAGGVSHDLVELLDIYPTLMDLCGCQRADCVWPLQGRSLAATLSGSAPVDRAYTVSTNWSQATIVTAQWKLGRWLVPASYTEHDYRAFGDMLFNRETDPGEVHNLYNDPSVAEVQALLNKQLDAWLAANPIGAPSLGLK